MCATSKERIVRGISLIFIVTSIPYHLRTFIPALSGTTYSLDGRQRRQRHQRQHNRLILAATISQFTQILIHARLTVHIVSDVREILDTALDPVATGGLVAA